MKFRKKPIVIEAVRVSHVFDGNCPKWLYQSDTLFHAADRTMTVQTLEGPLLAREDDWIIQGVNGELYPCKPDIFEKTYEPVEE